MEARPCSSPTWRHVTVPRACPVSISCAGQMPLHRSDIASRDRDDPALAAGTMAAATRRARMSLSTIKERTELAGTFLVAGLLFAAGCGGGRSVGARGQGVAGLRNA